MTDNSKYGRLSLIIVFIVNIYLSSIEKDLVVRLSTLESIKMTRTYEA